MLITYFIGNGFDLNNNLQTKFSDFYEYIESAELELMTEDNAIYTEIKDNKDEWSYFEKKLGELTWKYTQETKQKLLTDLVIFRTHFMEYMGMQNDSFSFDGHTAKKILTDSLTQYINQLSKQEKQDMIDVYKLFAEDRNFKFVNFNYTDTLEQIVNQVDKNSSITSSYVKNSSYRNVLKDIIYVHRQLDSGMFLGVDDETQINSEIFNDIEKSFLIKPLANEDIRDNTNKEVEDLINDSNIIIIYGMSLGKTDKKWWELIGKWLEKKSENRLIIYVYDEGFSQINPLSYFQKRREFENRLIEYSYDLDDEEVKEEIRELRKKIYLISNSKSDFKFSPATD